MLTVLNPSTFESVHKICPITWYFSNFMHRSLCYPHSVYYTNLYSLQPCLHRWSTKDDDRWIRSWFCRTDRQLDRHQLWCQRWSLLPRCRNCQSCRPYPLPCSSSCRLRVNLWWLFENIINLFYLHKLYLFLAMERCGWVFCGQLLNAEWDRSYSDEVSLSFGSLLRSYYEQKHHLKETLMVYWRERILPDGSSGGWQVLLGSSVGNHWHS